MTIILVGLIIYFIFLFAFAIFSAFAVYHLFQFCYVGDLCRPVAVGYLVAAGAIILFTLILTLASVA